MEQIMMKKDPKTAIKSFLIKSIFYSTDVSTNQNYAILTKIR